MIRFFTRHIGNLDSKLCVKISGMQGRKVLDRTMYIFSRQGDGHLYPLIGVLVAILDFAVALRMIAMSAVAFTFQLSSYQLLKTRIKRTRPFERMMEITSLIKPPDKFSFPSGHTAASFVVATIVSSFYPYLTIPTYANASLIGFSRVYNGVHYPGDVVAGAALGLLSGQIGLMMF